MLRVIVAVLLCAMVLACSEDRHLDEENSDPVCEDLSWRAPTEGEVTCPQSADCRCGGVDICCVDVDAEFAILGARCDELVTCEGLAFECDGPEDCGDDEICCAVMTSGGGSTCTTTTECHGVDELVMCRSDTDCQGIEHCMPAGDGSYFEDDAATCQL